MKNTNSTQTQLSTTISLLTLLHKHFLVLTMAIRMPRIIHAKQFLKRSLFTEQNGASTATDIPKGCFAVYVGEGEKKRHMIPVAYLSKSLFQDLLVQAEEEYGFVHPMGGITIPCKEDVFVNVISQLSSKWVGLQPTSQFCKVETCIVFSHFFW